MIDNIVNLDLKKAKDFEGLTILYKKIFNYLLFKNKELVLHATEPLLEPPASTFMNIEKEVAAALESVIPRAALGPFVSLAPSEKVTQLCELSNLIIGIRLFNKEIGKGGVSFTAVQDLVKHTGRQVSEDLGAESIEIVSLCDNYSLFFHHMNKISHPYKANDISRIKDELTFLRQYLAYLLNLQEDVEMAESVIETNENKYLKEIAELKDLLGNKSSAPKEQVYPKFASVAQAYSRLVDEKKASYMRLNLFKILLAQREKLRMTLNLDLLHEARKQGQEQVVQSPKEVDIDPMKGITRLLPSNTRDFMQTPLDFLGFCIWTILHRDGLLLSGKPNLGVFRFKDKHCVFVDDEAIKEYVENPDIYLGGVIDQCKKHPELIHLLRLDEHFATANLNLLLQSKEGTLTTSSKLMVDKGQETPLHFIEKNIDPNYCWNEWELRKKAIQFANIRNRQTKACQTILSNFKVEAETQVWPPKTQETQTGLTSGVNPTRPRNYITGLRQKSESGTNT